jgi:hypothetical protein
MASLTNDDLNGTYVDPNKTAWGGNAGDAPIDHYSGPMGVDQYGIPTPTGDRASWLQAQKDAQATSGQYLDVSRYRGMGEAAANRNAPRMNYTDAYGGLDEAAAQRALGGQARQSQLSALALQRQAAEGKVPSQAQLLGRNMLDQGLQAQLAGAASARGGGMAQAAAMRQAAQGAAAFQQQGVNNLSALRAQEMATARDAYQQGAYGIRAGDYAGATNANQSAAQFAQMEQMRAANEMQQRTLNQNGQQFYEQQAFNVNQAALNANLGLAGNAQANDQFRTQMAMADQQRSDAMWAAAMGAGSTVMAGAVTRRASGGPIAPGQPVLVGERGPEVIVPAQSGTVLPATHPASQQAARQNMTMADVARLRQQADEIERGLRSSLASGPAVGGKPRTITVAPVVIGDGPGSYGESVQPRQVDMSVAPRERLYGGREDPYTPDPYYVPLDHAAPTWGERLYGGREDPYAAPTMADVASRRAA